MSNSKQEIYDELCRVLTDYEGNGSEERTSADDLYYMLVRIQNNWESVITADAAADKVVANVEKRGGCLACSNSMSEPAASGIGTDKLFCVVKQDYVGDDEHCNEFN